MAKKKQEQQQAKPPANRKVSKAKFRGAHNKRYDLFIDGEPITMVATYPVYNSDNVVVKYVDEVLPAHALPLHYMQTAPNAYDLLYLPDAIARHEQMVLDYTLKANILYQTAGDAAKRELHTVQIALRHLPGMIALMYERLEDTVQVYYGTWEYEIYNEGEML